MAKRRRSHRNDGSDITSTINRGWAELREGRTIREVVGANLELPLYEIVAKLEALGIRRPATWIESERTSIKAEAARRDKAGDAALGPHT